MTESPPSTLDIPPDDRASAETTAPPSVREQQLRDLLGTDYDFAHESGLIDMFVYDPDKGIDGLFHVLVGETEEDVDGNIVVKGGFHHEPSPQMSDLFSDKTHVNREPPEGSTKPSKKKDAPRFEPYRARVKIEGFKKYSKGTDSDGKTRVFEASNMMFPKEYDPLAVLQAIRIAKEGRDPALDSVSETEGKEGYKVATGIAPMLDDEHTMELRLVMDPDTDQLITAFPLVGKRNRMGLSAEAAQRLLVGGSPKTSTKI